MNTSAELRNDFAELLDRRDFSSVEELWMAAIEKENPEELPEIELLMYAADGLLAATEKGRAQVLLDLTVPVYEARLSPEQMLEILRRKCLAASDDIETRRNFAEAFRSHYGPTSVETEFLKISEFEQIPYAEKAFRALDHWQSFRKGSYVHHGSGWGTGQITAVDGLLKQATVNLEKKPNHRMALEALGAVLEPLPDEHFLALKFQGGDRIRELIETDPVAMIGIVLSSFRNPAPLREVKEPLCPAFITTAGWSKWWNRAKKQLRENGHYSIENRSPFLIEKREVAISYEDEMIGQFQGASWTQRRDLVRTAFKARAQHPRFIASASEVLSAELDQASGPDSVLAAALFQRLSGDTGSGSESSVGDAGTAGQEAPDAPQEGGPIIRALRSCDDPVAALCRLPEGDEQRLVLKELATFLGEGWGEATKKLWVEGGDTVRDELLERVESDGLLEDAQAVLQENLSVPRQGPDCFLWCVRKYVAGKHAGPMTAYAEVEEFQVLRKVVELLDFLDVKGGREGREVVRDHINKIRTLLSQKNYTFFRRVVDNASDDNARSLYRRMMGIGGLSESQQTEMIDILIRRFPGLLAKEEVPIWEQDVIFVTPLGLQIRQEEFRVLREETLPEVFEDIGRAAAFGDLRENAEYKAALERRDQLTKKAEDIEEELKKASLITPEHLIDGEVTLGAKVTLENLDSGQEIAYRVLGPWDADPDRGVLSYKSPLGRSFLGTHEGDEVEVELPSGTIGYRVRGVESGINAE